MDYFTELKNLSATEALSGVLLRTLQTQNLTIAYSEMQKGSVIPLHKHPEEAIDVVLDGILEMQVGEQTETLTSGMITIVPSNVPHRAIAITDCKVITVFYPKRNL